MREIKFRAWEKNLKAMISVDSIDLKARLINMESAWRMFEEIEIMQYTGLKDKNGVEIYEGDIITILRQEESYIIQGSGWEDVDTVEGFEFTGVVEVMYSVLCLKIDRKRGIPIDLDVCELIGNIYENPELLEEDLR